MKFSAFSTKKRTFGGEYICYCKEVDEESIVQAIEAGNTTLKSIKEHTTACGQ